MKSTLFDHVAYVLLGGVCLGHYELLHQLFMGGVISQVVYRLLAYLTQVGRTTGCSRGVQSLRWSAQVGHWRRCGCLGSGYFVQRIFGSGVLKNRMIFKRMFTFYNYCQLTSGCILFERDSISFLSCLLLVRYEGDVIDSGFESEGLSIIGVVVDLIML